MADASKFLTAFLIFCFIFSEAVSLDENERKDESCVTHAGNYTTSKKLFPTLLKNPNSVALQDYRFTNSVSTSGGVKLDAYQIALIVIGSITIIATLIFTSPCWCKCLIGCCECFTDCFENCCDEGCSTPDCCKPRETTDQTDVENQDDKKY
ncbi:unnamed protein product [Owenia fusiformis]|uniref:Uncharacterized protein n=1 Tax=Owenia fusiformis TaxID=6347 RepID=A0A8J1T9N8_OWEFU|nr:unnamed protein product [Owenia fusiformis]